jgi:hypothetical protein
MLLSWNIYEIESTGAVLHGIKLRGRIRKFTIEKGITCLVENASDKENTVRFAVITGADPEEIFDFVKTLLSSSTITMVLEKVPNPVLSKIKVNDVSRYSIDEGHL